MHKNTKLLPHQRRAVYEKWLAGEKVVSLARRYEVSRETIYKIIRRARLGEFNNRKSVNIRFKTIEFGLKRLSKIEKKLALRLEKQERRKRSYEKEYPGEMIHLDSKVLPHIEGENTKEIKREHLFVAIDDYSRVLFADIMPSKTQYSGALFLEEAVRDFSFPIITAYSDNGGEFKGNQNHQVTKVCKKYEINQQFTKPRTPRTNGKAERVIKTLLNEWFRKHRFISREERRKSLYKFVEFYNRERLHQGINNLTPLQKLHSCSVQEVIHRQNCQQRLQNVQIVALFK